MVGRNKRKMAGVWMKHQRAVAAGPVDWRVLKPIWNRYTTAQCDSLKAALLLELELRDVRDRAEERKELLLDDLSEEREQLSAAVLQTFENIAEEKQRHLVALANLIRLEEEVGASADVLKNDRDNRKDLLKDEKQMLEQLDHLRESFYDDGDEDEKRRKKAHFRTQRNTPPKRHGHTRHPWQSHRRLGTGAFGAVGVWLKHDQNEYITDRIAVKDAHLRYNAWYNTSLWDGNIRVAAEKVPKEVTAMQLLRGRTDKIVRLRSWRMFNHKAMYRLYLEYCAHGDVDAVCQHYYAEIATQAEEDGQDPIPEPAIWRMLASLVEAGIVMEQGNLNHTRSGWEDMVHCDFKPENIFLSTPRGPPFALFPTVKLGDFGLAIRTSAADKENPKGYWTRGTREFLAPEQVRKDPATAEDNLVDDPDLLPSEVDKWKLSSATNVYGIGITMQMLMNQGYWPRPRWHDRSNTDELPLSDWAEDKYSRQLQSVVMQCVQYKPVDRPTYARLREWIDMYTGGPGSDDRPDRAQGMRTRTREDEDEPFDPHLAMWYPGDRYAVNSLLLTSDASSSSSEESG